MRIRFLFYKQERVVSSVCMKLGELLDLIARGYPGAQILQIEVVEKTPTSNQSHQRSYGYEKNIYSDPISAA
jgi:hypothetical protein